MGQGVDRHGVACLPASPIRHGSLLARLNAKRPYLQLACTKA